jgi:hypothetical protein
VGMWAGLCLALMVIGIALLLAWHMAITELTEGAVVRSGHAEARVESSSR